jgi:transcriptional regulator with XRE-family HTH domain
MGKALAEALKTIRGVRGYSLRKVEDKTKISNAYLFQLESGKAENPSPHILHKLAECYGVSYELLMKAAGYIRTHSPVERKPTKVSALQAALMSAGLGEEEEKKIAEYIKFLRSQRPRRTT